MLTISRYLFLWHRELQTGRPGALLCLYCGAIEEQDAYPPGDAGDNFCSDACAEAAKRARRRLKQQPPQKPLYLRFGDFDPALPSYNHETGRVEIAKAQIERLLRRLLFQP